MKEQLEFFLEHLALNENASDHTVRAYQSDLTQFLRFLAQQLQRSRGEVVPQDIDRGRVREFLSELHKRGNSRASAARKLAAIRAFGRFLKREGVVDNDPAAFVGTPKREQRLPAHLGEGEMSRLLETPDTSQPLGRRDRAILELFYASGLRLSELVGLDVDDINLSSRVVRVLGKGRKERIVPFNRSTEDALRAWLKDWESIGAPEKRGRSPFSGKAQKGDCPYFPQLPGTATLDAQRRSLGPKICCGVQHAVRDQSARAAALVRYAPARTWSRPARHSGTTRPRSFDHDPALHARQRRAAHRDVSKDAPEGIDKPNGMTSI